MELGLSLGDAPKAPAFEFLRENKSTHKQRKINGASSGICMALGLGSSAAAPVITNSQEQQISQEYDGGGGGGGGDGDDDDDDSHTSYGHVHQLNLLPLVPVNPLRNNISSHLQSSGSSENIGSSGNVGPPAAKGLNVNRLTADEVSSSENSVGPRPPFGMDLGGIICDGRINNNLLSIDIGSHYKRCHEEASGNDVVEAERASDDDDINGLNSTRKKLRLSKQQSAFLEESFREHSTPNPKQKQALAKQLNLRPRQVEVWFQNRRARTKLKQTEVDCEYLKRCCGTLTEENRRLQKELQELRALKTCNPFHMQQPPTTLTMCPSCERVATTTTTNTALPPPSSTTGNTAGPIPFPLNRPRLYPFSQTAPTNPSQSTRAIIN